MVDDLRLKKGTIKMRLFLFVLIPNIWSIGQDAPSITYVYYGDQDIPLWVSREASVSDGAFNMALFSETDQMRLTRYQKAYEDALAWSRKRGENVDAGDGCLLSTEVHRDFIAAYHEQTLAECVTNARAAVSGVVLATYPGFYMGEPRTMLVVHVAKVVKEGAGMVVGREIYLIHPYAHFSVGGVTYCREDTDTLGAVHAGDRILFFVDARNRTGEDNVFSAGNHELVVASNGRPVRMSEKLRKLDVGKPSQIETWLEQARN